MGVGLRACDTRYHTPKLRLQLCCFGIDLSNAKLVAG